MAEDDPADLDRYREEALRKEFAKFCYRYSPLADFYTLAARFSLVKLHEAEGARLGHPDSVTDLAL